MRYCADRPLRFHNKIATLDQLVFGNVCRRIALTKRANRFAPRFPTTDAKARRREERMVVYGASLNALWKCA
jgi:hypothetical protein